MPSVAATQLNRSQRTLSDLQQLATQSPEEAERFLLKLGEKLRSLDQVTAAATIEKILDGTGGLVERLQQHATQLGEILPPEPAAMGELQTRRAATIGWTAEQPPPLQYLSGTVKSEDGRMMFTTFGGKTFELLQSYRVGEHLPIEMDTLGGVIADSEKFGLTIQGTVCEGGTQFKLEGYALNVNGQYDRFTFGRVKVDEHRPGQVFISTPRGEVEVTDEELKRQLTVMPNLGVILAGEPEQQGDRRVYPHRPRHYFGLGRFTRSEVQDTGWSTPFGYGDMAFSYFKGKPISVEREYAPRITESNGERIWLHGRVRLDEQGTPSMFTSTYCSHSVDRNVIAPSRGVNDAGVIEAAVMVTELD